MKESPGEKGFSLAGRDGKEIYVRSWEGTQEPEAVVQIFHGMTEHGGRYGRFAGFLNSRGVAVYADDHRGHGKTAGTVDKLGQVGEDGFNRTVEDEYVLTRLIKERYPGIPVFLFAHSYGSFLAQDYITRYGREIAGVILSGTSMMNGPGIGLGTLIALAEKVVYGGYRPSSLIDHMTFSGYNRRIKDAVNKFSWLSRDEDEVRKYIEDPLCGNIFTAEFYHYFFRGLSKLYGRRKTGKIPRSLPVLIAVGGEDPVGRYGAGARRLYGFYKYLGLQDVEFKLYPGARHEILNETNRDEVSRDVLEWMKKRMG